MQIFLLSVLLWAFAVMPHDGLAEQPAGESVIDVKLDLRSPVSLSAPASRETVAASLDDPASETEGNSGRGCVRKWICFDIGFRGRQVELREKRRDVYDEERQSYFLGSINELKEEDPIRLRPVLRVWFFSRVGLEAGWDRIRARTITAFDGHSDGVFESSGPTIAGCLRLPLGDRIIPVGGVGRGFWDASFEPDPWWGLGYSDEATWLELGAPSTPRNNRTRVIETSSDPMNFWFLGCGVRLWSQLYLDLEYRRVSHDVDAVFTVRQFNTPITRPLTGRIPLGYDEWAVGLSWHF